MLSAADLEKTVALRRRLHACPERSGRERATMGEIAAFLRAHTALDVEDRGGWLLATHREGEGLPDIAFRADMDALPAEGGDARHGGDVRHGGDARHGCGHDGHCAILCGFALALEGARVGANVRLVFQPAEETGEGARMIRESWPGLRNLRRVYGLHNIPGQPLGAMLLREGCFACASVGLIARIHGRPAHAAYPGDGANPAELMSRVVLELPGMIQEALGGGDRLLMHTVIGLRAGGEDFGMSASEGQLCLTLRGHRQEDIDALVERIQARVRAGCGELGMTCAFELRDPFPDTTNDPAVTAESVATLRRAGLPVVMLEAPMRWSEDFGWYLKAVPGMFFGVGLGEASPGLHTRDYRFDDAVIPPAVAAFMALARQAEK